MIKKILIFTAKASCFLALFVGLQQCIELKTRGFCLQKILASDLPTVSEWDNPALSEQAREKVLHALNQPYTFLGAGSECFAFLSEDGETVIKFFKLDTCRPVYFFRGLFAEDHSAENAYFTLPGFLPAPLYSMAQRVLGMRAFRIKRTFGSLKVAHETFREETGMLYLHLNPTEELHTALTLYDPCGIAHTIDLDSTRFYLQKRATSFKNHLLRLKNRGEHTRAEQCLASLCDLILKRCKRGFADRDLYLKNFGFIGDVAVETDTGSFLFCEQMKEPKLYKQELLFATCELREWTEEHYSALLPALLLRISAEIASDV